MTNKRAIEASATLTADPTNPIVSRCSEQVPGLVVFYSGGSPAYRPIAVGERPIVFGRAPSEAGVVIDDRRISRRQTLVSRCASGLMIKDLQSRNGTFVDARRVHEVELTTLPRVLRMGHTLLRFTPNIAPFLGGGVGWVNGGVVGPTLRESRALIERTASTGTTVLLTGPSGVGKELAARAFHSATGRTGPFIAVNCAAIPSGLAERLLFGVRRGAYSGAVADAEGYVQAANGGTLFLDEIAELDIAVQPKLLRMLEENEVLELGAARPRRVDVRVCSATLRDLRVEVATGRFREDLYYRIGRPEVRIPTLVERLEELPFLVKAELDRLDPHLMPSALFLEAVALRCWPGNVRELLLEVRQAARAALDTERSEVRPEDLSPMAGLALSPDTGPSKTAAGLSREAIEAALRGQKGNVTRAARTLGLYRNQLRRRLTREGIDPTKFAEGSDGEAVLQASRPPDTQ